MTKQEPIRVEQTFSKSIDSVWNAITQIDQMRQWFFENLETFKPEVGFETQLNVQSHDKDFLHIWRITEVIPKKKMVLNWRYDGYSGDSNVTFELMRENDSTNLTVTHEGIESFPQDVPEFSRESCLGGWHYFIRESLKSHLDG